MASLVNSIHSFKKNVKQDDTFQDILEKQHYSVSRTKKDTIFLKENGLCTYVSHVHECQNPLKSLQTESNNV